MFGMTGYNKEEYEIKKELDELTKDFIQVLCGANIPDIEEKRVHFQILHNKLRALPNKEPRIYKEN